LALAAWMAGIVTAEEEEEIVDRVDPARWVLWRCGPFPFPTSMTPHDPERLPLGPPIDFGEGGRDLVIVVPAAAPTGGSDSDALQGMVRLIRKKTPRAEVTTLVSLSPVQRRKHLLAFGLASEVGRIAPAVSSAGFDGFGPGGYRLTHRASPFAPSKRLIVGMGRDPRGVWATAAILAFAIHPRADRLGELGGSWPVHLGDGTYWTPFEAENRGETPREESPAFSASAMSAAKRGRPLVPFGVRIWGSPMPTMPSYRRLVRALAGLEINTIVVQPGGWPDLPKAECTASFREALDAAWAEGLSTVLYAGNEIDGHLPSPLTANHEAIVAAVADHPGLLGWHLYNQLTSRLSPAQRELVRAQMRLVGEHARRGRPLANEVVWGHNLVEPPADKIALIEELKSWGMTALATDYAPIGGWSREPDPSRWEGRLRAAQRFKLPLEAVLQAHVPFLEPRVPTDLEVRNQYWWALAGGARAFYFDCAYNFTHFSNRGLLTWDLREQDDGRCAEIRRLAEATRRLEPLIARGEPDEGAETAALGLRLEAEEAHEAEKEAGLALRVRRTPDGARWLLVINKSLDRARHATITLADTAPRFDAREVVPGSDASSFAPGSPLVARIPPGGAACFRLSAAGDTPSR
jgi:hypothetical protein